MIPVQRSSKSDMEAICMFLCRYRKGYILTCKMCFSTVKIPRKGQININFLFSSNISTGNVHTQDVQLGAYRTIHVDSRNILTQRFPFRHHENASFPVCTSYISIDINSKRAFTFALTRK